MIRARFRFVSVALFCIASLASVFAADRKAFTTSPQLSQEASALINILERLHYNRDAVRSSQYADAIPDYMSDLDGQRLFFLGSDKAKFLEEHGKNIYYNTAFLGNIDAAYRIFEVYETRVQARVAWIMEELKKDYDLTVNETYRPDRSKSEWPLTPAESDDLWRKRLKYELVEQLLIKKLTPAAEMKETFGINTTLAPEAPKPVADAAKTPDPVEEAKTTIRKRYERMLKNLGEIEGNDLAENYLTAISKLYDPHSTYFSPATYEDFSIQMRLQLVGIGAVLGLEEDVCVVKEIVPGGPADLGRQLKPNDKIIAVAQENGEPVEIIGMKLRKIVDMIRGQKDTKVHLTVQPGDASDSSARKEIVISRDVVKLDGQRARAAVFQVTGADGKSEPLGVITLPAFYATDEGDTDAEKASASTDVARLIERLKEKKVQGIVLDLRRNGGGYLGEAIELAGLFINRGPVVQVRTYNGEVTVDEDKNAKISYDGPLAVLVDRFSASASEIVAGALQNYGRGVVVGDSSTHGKGSVQQILDMRQFATRQQLAANPKMGAAKFTIQKYYLPSGTSTQLKGVVPDIVLPSINEFLPIGESDLPHALVWDQIPTSTFDGSPLNTNVLTPLRQASLDRQQKLPEFAYLRKSVDWMKARQDEKLVSINLDERKRQKEEDDTFRKALKAEKDEIAKSDYPFEVFYLGGPPPAKIKAPKKEGEEEDIFFDEDENETYVKADVHLRETLRILHDALALGQNKDLFVKGRPPLTARVGG